MSIVILPSIALRSNTIHKIKSRFSPLDSIGRKQGPIRLELCIEKRRGQKPVLVKVLEKDRAIYFSENELKIERRRPSTTAFHIHFCHF